MGHRGLPNQAEMLAVMRLLADVAALKGDPPAQRQRLTDGLSTVFRTTLGWTFALDDWRPDRRPRMASGVLASGLDPSWQQYVADFAVRVAPADDPYGAHSMASDAVEQHWVQRQVMPDRAAYRRYSAAAEVIESAKIGDGTVGLFRTGPGGHRVAGFSLHRTRGDRRMTARDHALHRFALAEVRRLAECGHLSLAPPPEPTLPPRQRQVLAGLKAGRTPKAIALEMGRSVHTVREHMNALYVKFGVNGRDELMAKFIRDRA